MNVNVICTFKQLLLAIHLEWQYAGSLLLYYTVAIKYSVNTHDKKTSLEKSEVFMWQTFDSV